MNFRQIRRKFCFRKIFLKLIHSELVALATDSGEFAGIAPSGFGPSSALNLRLSPKSLMAPTVIIPELPVDSPEVVLR